MEYGITFNKIVDDIINDVYGGIPSDEYSREQVRFKVLRWRELLLRRDIERNDIDPLYLQSIVVTFAKTTTTLPCGGGGTCYVLKSSDTVPRLIRGKVTHVWTLEAYQDDMTENADKSIYTPIYSFDARWIKTRRMSNKMKYAYIDTGGHLYVINDEYVRYTLLKGVFFDPREAARFSTCDGAPCYTDDDPFPMSGDLINVLYAEIIKEIKTAIYGTQKQEENADTISQ